MIGPAMAMRRNDPDASRPLRALIRRSRPMAALSTETVPNSSSRKARRASALLTISSRSTER